MTTPDVIHAVNQDIETVINHALDSADAEVVAAGHRLLSAQVEGILHITVEPPCCVCQVTLTSPGICTNELCPAYSPTPQQHQPDTMTNDETRAIGKQRSDTIRCNLESYEEWCCVCRAAFDASDSADCPSCRRSEPWNLPLVTPS